MTKSPKYTFAMTGAKRAKIELYDLLGPRWAGMIDARMVSQSLRDAGPIDHIELRINSQGGSAFEGMAIANLLKDHPATVDVVVDGIAGSAASLPLMAGDTRRVPKNALVMIHDPSTFASGNETQMLSAIANLRAVKKAVVALYASRSTKSENEIAAMMTKETYFTGDEALAMGFATTTGDDLPAEQAPVKDQMALPPFTVFDRELLPDLAVPQLELVTKEPQMANNPAPATPAPTTPAPTAPPPATAVTAPVVPSAVPAPQLLTQADVDAAAKKAVEDERNRANDITSLCTKAGCQMKAADFIASGKAAREVKDEIFDVLCQNNKPIGDGSSTAEPAKDPDAKYKAEYAKARDSYMKIGTSEADYIAMRRIDDGVDALKHEAPKA